MTIALEHIQEGDWAALNRIVDALRMLTVDTGGVSLGIRVGTDTVTFSGSATSATKTIDHGLGRTPAAVFAQGVGGAAFCWLQVNSTSATQIVVQGHDVDNTARTGTNSFYWAAIG